MQSAQARSEPETVTYQFEIDADVWDAWKREIPREKSLADRLCELIALDRDLAADDFDSVTLRLVDQKIDRAGTLAHNAAGDIEEGADARAIDKCERIQDLAATLDLGTD